MLVAGLVSANTSAALTPSATGLSLSTVANRADLVSGGDALVRISAPRGVQRRAVRLTLNGNDITSAFWKLSDGHGLGLVNGLILGANTLTAAVDGQQARLTITNHPLGGPVFSGPQIQPWTCGNASKSPTCDAPPSFAYFYVPVGANDVGTCNTAQCQSALRAYDPANPPPAASIANTTTLDGVTVPFIVRQESGYIDRDQYSIAALWQPGQPWTAWHPQRQFNHRMVITHGASCDEQYQSAAAPTVLDQKTLAEGFLVISNALDNAGHACNLVVQAEALVMTKEYAIDHYGTVRWTIGQGCSGGSLVQQQVANAYPGIYQGIIPQCSFTDAWSSSMEYVDYVMLLKYWKDPSRWTPGNVWDPRSMSAVLDHPNAANPVTFTTAIPNSADPAHACVGLSAAQQYNATTNRSGVRCTLADYTVNVVGRRPQDGFANRPFDNVGIQYGLKALREGVISAAQFTDLNSHLGGLDIDGNVQQERIAGDRIGLQRAYRSGLVNTASNLDQVAIIDLRGPDPGAFHDVYRTYAMRARLLRNFGTAANQVLWRGQVPLSGDVHFIDQAVRAMDTWLSRVDADHSGANLSVKIIRDKPSALAERCTNGAGVDLESWVCDQTVAPYGTPRFGADEPLTDDILKCQLKPLRRDDYPVSFTDPQWRALQTAFPDGVCNYGEPGVDQMTTATWLTYQSPSGAVLYGGQPLGAPPVSTTTRS